jgi:hypothetical protein
MVPNDLYRFLNAASARHDILRHDETLAGPDFKATTQYEPAIAILLDEDVSPPKMAGDFLSHNDPADCWRYHGFGIIRAEIFREHSAYARRDGRVLEQEGALEKFATVQAAAKDKVAVEQGSGLFEKFQNVLH